MRGQLTADLLTSAVVPRSLDLGHAGSMFIIAGMQSPSSSRRTPVLAAPASVSVRLQQGSWS